MTFKITITRRENQTLNEILMDVIAASAYFDIRDIEAQEEGEDKITFYHAGHIPIEEYDYLSRKYKPNLCVSVVEN